MRFTSSMALTHVLACAAACALPLLACGTSSTGAGSTASATKGGPAADVLYVESNNPARNGNAVLGFHRNADGSLTPLASSPFVTGGEGVADPTGALGPLDADQQIVVTPDHTRLFAVNSGSNTIAVFDVTSTGALLAVPGSPFASFGIEPVSLGYANGRLYVVNKAQDPNQPCTSTPSTGQNGQQNNQQNGQQSNQQNGQSNSQGGNGQQSGNGQNAQQNGQNSQQGGESQSGQQPAQVACAPNYTVFDVAADGRLIHIPNSEMSAGASPSQALISPDQRHLFGADFMAPAPLRSFVIQPSGLLLEAPGSPMALPGAAQGNGAALGLTAHPTQQILYAGFVQRAQVGVYTYDAAGALTFVTAASDSGAATCWLTMNAAGTRLYAVNSGDASISVFDASDPLAPTEIQKLTLRLDASAAAPFQEALSPDGRFLYVVAQRTSQDPSVTTGNAIHVLAVASDGSLRELAATSLAVPIDARPQGIVAF